MSILEGIHSPDDVKNLADKDLPVLCGELRQRLVDCVSQTGGHLASNLGVVELTVAIHRVFDTFQDRLVFDVGHQSYVHKLLTGRNECFDSLRTLGGISGFPRPDESGHDAFIAGHASTAISAALGMARARTLQGKNYNVLALVGDGALTGGLAYEALNDLGQSGEALVVILNDNGMSITRNVGGVARHLAKQRMKPAYFTFKKNYRLVMGKIPGGKSIYRFTHKIKQALKNALLHCSMFEEMGLEYMGPVDGYDLNKLCYFLRWARDLKKPVIVHVNTRKGKGAVYAERNPDQYHGVGKFDPLTGDTGEKTKDFSAVFGQSLCALAEENEKVCAITAAMQEGTGLHGFVSKFPMRFFDVGIAEEHAAVMAAGLAKQGMLPVFAVYSTFLQRAYDMLLHDIAIQGLHVVLAVDRAGLCGADGMTHHGVFDVGFLSQVPGMTLLAPASFRELESLLRHALFDLSGPVALRYPRGGEGAYKEDSGLAPKLLRPGRDLIILTYGDAVNEALSAADKLAGLGIQAGVLKLTKLCPLELSELEAYIGEGDKVLAYEYAAAPGCVGEKLFAALEEKGLRLKGAKLLNFGNGLIAHGDFRGLLAQMGMDGDGIVQAALEMMETDGKTALGCSGI